MEHSPRTSPCINPIYLLSSREAPFALAVQAILDPIEYLVFSGGALKGYAFVGVLDYVIRLWRFGERNLLRELKGCCGTSIGALFALMCVSLLSVDQMQDHMDDHRIDDVLPHFLDYMSLFQTYGLIKGDLLDAWMTRILSIRFGDEKITFGELYHRTGRTLKIVTSDVVQNQPLIFSHLTHPNEMIKTALVASMSVPPLFAPVVWRDSLLVDGGVYLNFHIDAFPIDRTLGLCFDFATENTPIQHFGGYIMALVESILNHKECEKLQLLPASKRKRIIDIVVRHVYAFGFHVDPADVTHVRRCGFDAAHRFVVLRMAPNFFALLVLYLLESKLLFHVLEHQNLVETVGHLQQNEYGDDE